MAWQAAIAPNPVLAMAGHALLCGSRDDESVLQLASGIVIAILLGWHAKEIWLCRCISACCAASLCPEGGLAKVVVIVCSFAKPAFGKGGHQGGDKSDAAQPAALSSAVQNLVEAIRKLGRIPKQNQGTSEDERAENKLAKWFSDHQHSIPGDVLQKLRALGGAYQPAALSSTVQRLVEQAKQFGRCPTQGKTASPEKQKKSNKR